MLRNTLYIIILSAAFCSVILSLMVVLAENIEEKENLQKYLEEYKQWAKGEISKYKDYSENLKLRTDSLSNEKQELSKQYDFLSDEYLSVSESKQVLQKQYEQDQQLFEQEISTYEKEIKSQQKELEQLERSQIEEIARTNPVVKALIEGQLKFYIEPVPNYASSKVEDGVTGFSQELENYQFFTNLKFKRVYTPNDAHIQISWIKNYGSHVLGESIFKSVVHVGLGAENCYGDWQPFTAQTVMLIFWHELGHSMGFGHSNDPDNIMYYETDTRFVTDYDETIALDEGEYITLPFCHGGTMQYQVSSEDQYNGFHLYVLPPETDSTNFIEYKIGQYYPNCSTEKQMIKFGDTCTVPDGAKLVIYNPDDLLNLNVIRVDTTIYDLNELKIPADLRWDMGVFEYDEDWLNQIWNMYH